jgi:hypothetical protein
MCPEATGVTKVTRAGSAVGAAAKADDGGNDTAVIADCRRPA